MQQSRSNGAPHGSAPRFHLIEKQRPRPIAILLAILVAAGVIYSVSYGLGHSRARRLRDEEQRASRTVGSSSPDGSHENEDEKDDPNQIDTVVLGDAADAPVPARKKDHVSPVHATILIQLPRYGQQTGLIPDTPSGHLLYRWMAAFNQGSFAALREVLPNMASGSAAAAQMTLRLQTGGFSLLSAKEIQPGVLVFRLRDQTPEGNEVLGTLVMLPNSSPPTIDSLSLRSIPGTAPKNKPAVVQHQ